MAVQQARQKSEAAAADDWPTGLYDVLKAKNVRQMSYVPDAGHSKLISLLSADPEVKTTVLTTEEEGIAIAAGAWLGGERSVILMQSSGVGNCINAIASLTMSCRLPLLTLVTMRGEWGEGNPWQIPMGRAVQPVLESLGMRCVSVHRADEVEASVSAMAAMSFNAGSANAVLLSQRLVGAKAFK